jgi:anti-sigma factor RsiW
MADIIRLNGDIHAQTQHLLPWFVTGALSGKEAAQVEKHLAECADCRADMEIEKTLAREVRTLPCDVDRGWAMLKARLDEPRPQERRPALFSRRIPIGWAVAAQAAGLAIVATCTLTQPQLLYRTLGSPSGAPAGNLIVIFRPDAPEAALRATLTRNQARIVDGPASTGAYVLHVPADQRPAVLARLQSDRNIALAEPIDTQPGPGRRP